jgi:hypothetical protein
MNDMTTTMINDIVDDQWVVILDTSLPHDRRCRAFIVMMIGVATMAGDSLDKMPPERVQEMFRERAEGVGPLEIVNTLHVMADAMAMVIALDLTGLDGFTDGFGL